MISRQFAVQQLERLAKMRSFPKEEDEERALEELIKALESADSERHAEETITEWIQFGSSQFCPLPWELRQALQEARKIGFQKAWERPPDCVDCGGSGFRTFGIVATATKSIDGEVQITKRRIEALECVAFHPAANQEFYTFAERCDHVPVPRANAEEPVPADEHRVERQPIKPAKRTLDPDQLDPPTVNEVAKGLVQLHTPWSQHTPEEKQRLNEMLKRQVSEYEKRRQEAS